MANVKKQIEMKKDRLTRLVLCGQISRSYANELLKEYAQFVCRYFGCGAQLFNNIPAVNILKLVIAIYLAIS